MLPPNPKKNLFCKIKSNNLFAKLYVHGIITKTNLRFCLIVMKIMKITELHSIIETIHENPEFHFENY